MSKKSIKSHFTFNKQERNGIFFLLLIILVLQGVSYWAKTRPAPSGIPALRHDAAWQQQLDSLKERVSQADSVTIYPFNPNYITDYRGYAMGLSPVEIDRLQAYRAENNFINSPEKFQEVTGISDSLLLVLTPYFKFPFAGRESGSLVSGKKGNAVSRDRGQQQGATGSTEIKGDVVYRDLNSATAEDLKQVRGIGDVLSVRIIKFRELLGGFLVPEQLNQVYGLEEEVVARIWQRFQILEAPRPLKININEASAYEISKLVYLPYPMAKKIVAYRESNGPIGSFDELTGIEGFPTERIDIIKLYLQL